MEITARLMAAASFVREGTFLCDVGTDHAYLPIYLAENGRIRACLASDIHEGPCESARAHIAENGFSEIIEVKRADGLAGFCPRGKTDIVIAGMGGALICEILEKAEGIKTGVALNPQTHPDCIEYLREYMDMLLVMTVSPGFAGQKIFEGAFRKCEDARKMLGESMLIEVDGNISLENGSKLSRSGADMFVLGTSSLFMKDKTLAKAAEDFRGVL